MKVQTMTITVFGNFKQIPDVAGLIQACVKENVENGRLVGNFFFKDLHVTFIYDERIQKHKGKRKASEDALDE